MDKVPTTLDIQGLSKVYPLTLKALIKYHFPCLIHPKYNDLLAHWAVIPLYDDGHIKFCTSMKNIKWFTGG